jgi:hypothetical protein
LAQGLVEIQDACLGGVVRPCAGEGFVACHGCHIDHAALDPPGYPIHREGPGGGDQSGEQIEFQDFLEELFVHIDKRNLASVSPYPVDEHVGGAAGQPFRFGDGRFAGFPRTGIHGDSENLGAGNLFGDIAGGLLHGMVGAPSPEDNLRPSLGEANGQAAGNAPGPAGYHHSLGRWGKH